MLHIYKINYNNYVVKQNLLLAMANCQSNQLGINCGISECYAFRENKRCAQHPFSRCNKSYPSHVHVDCHFKQCNSYPLHHRGFVRKLSLLQMFTKRLAQQSNFGWFVNRLLKSKLSNHRNMHTNISDQPCENQILDLLLWRIHKHGSLDK